MTSRSEYVSVIRTSDPPVNVSIRPDGFHGAERDAAIAASRHGNPAPRLVNRTMPRQDGISPLELSLAGLFARPWAFYWWWVLLAGLLLSGGTFVFASAIPSAYTKLIYAAFMAICVPAATLCLVTEWDISRCVNWSVSFIVAIIGGGVAAAISEILNHAFGISIDNSWLAALTEEPVKGAILLILLCMVRRFPGVLSGLALGFAVGAGFAICETIDYAYALSDNENPSIKVLVIRGMLSPMMHMAWTGALGGALWASRGIHANWTGVMFSWLSWLVFAGMIICHSTWNAFGGIYVLVIGVWVLILYLVKRGIAQAFTNNLVNKKVMR